MKEILAGSPPRKRPSSINSLWLLVALMALAALAIVLSACVGVAAQAAIPQVPGGDPARGRAELQGYGCTSCHTIAGVPGATGTVGPPLTGIGGRSMIAGRLPNNPDNMMRWIMQPQEVSPGTDMPDLGVTEASARDIAAYLYTLQSQP